MEGTFIPAKQRAQLTQQGRKSHFVFGKTSHGYSTTQGAFYKTNTSSASPGRPNNCRTASHFTLGSDSQSKRSEFGVNYRAHSLESQKPKPKIIDLTPTSIVMGMQEVKFQTTHGSFKDPGSARKQSYSNSPSKNRKHNFELGNDSPVRFSVMQKDFTKFDSEKPKHIDKSILESHIVMGGHPQMYKSVAENEFSKRDGSPGKLPEGKLRDLKKEHFLLGNDDPSKLTANNIHYKAVTTGNQSLSKEQLAYLKNSHFSFKSENPDYISVTKQTMNYRTPEKRTQEQYLKENHVVFGEDNRKFTTNYGRNHTYRSQSVNEPVRTKVDELNSDVVLGVTNPNMNSTTNSFMKGENGIPGRMDPQYERVLRGHHYQLGTSTNIYEQSHKNYGTGAPNPNKFLDNLKEDMLNTHWVSGFHKEELNTNMKREFKPASAEKRRVEDYLKKHNYKLGDSRNSWNSSYNGTFKWIQPVPDSKMKFSFD